MKPMSPDEYGKMLFDQGISSHQWNTFANPYRELYTQHQSVVEALRKIANDGPTHYTPPPPKPKPTKQQCEDMVLKSYCELWWNVKAIAKAALAQEE